MPSKRPKQTVFVKQAPISPAAAFFFLCAAMLACQSAPSGSSIEYGVDSCATCSRTISERRFAAQYTTGDGEVRHFDDPGCLFEAMHDDDARADSILFQDHRSDGWYGTADVWLVRTPGSQTPAGHGWVAYRDFSDAQDAVTSAGGGEVLRFAEAVKTIAPRAAE